MTKAELLSTLVVAGIGDLMDALEKSKGRRPEQERQYQLSQKDILRRAKKLLSRGVLAVPKAPRDTTRRPRR